MLTKIEDFLMSIIKALPFAVGVMAGYLLRTPISMGLDIIIATFKLIK